MRIRFIGSIGVITRDRSDGRRLFREGLDLPLKGARGSEFLYTERLGGSKYFGVWPLTAAAQACFGTPRWPARRPVPQMFLEFEVGTPASVSKAATELSSKGYTLLHPPRTDPWGQRVVRFQTPDGLIIGISHVPWMHRPARRRPRRTVRARR